MHPLTKAILFLLQQTKTEQIEKMKAAGRTAGFESDAIVQQADQSIEALQDYEPII